MSHSRDAPEHTLLELQKKALPAVDDCQLVNIARHFAPNSAKSVVLQSGRSERKARATRFLAIIRRDFGLEAFDQSVKSNPHSRSETIEHERKFDHE